MKKTRPSNSDENSQDLELPSAKHCLQITFPKKFSIKQELSFIDYIADAKSIFFSKNVYAVCQNVETAVALVEKPHSDKVPSGLIHSITRLGPAYKAFRQRVDEPTVLTIRKLAEGATYRSLAVRFPDAIDISIKKSMAKLQFSTREDCLEAYRGFGEVVWPGDQRPVAKPPTSRSSRETQRDLHEQFADDPTVVHIHLHQNFCLKKHIALLDFLNTASDIVLSEQCKVIFGSSTELLKREEALRDMSVMGGKLVVISYFDVRYKNEKKRAMEEPQSEKQQMKKTAKEGKKKRRLEVS